MTSKHHGRKLKIEHQQPSSKLNIFTNPADWQLEDQKQCESFYSEVLALDDEVSEFFGDWKKLYHKMDYGNNAAVRKSLDVVVSNMSSKELKEILQNLIEMCQHLQNSWREPCGMIKRHQGIQPTNQECCRPFE